MEKPQQNNFYAESQPLAEQIPENINQLEQMNKKEKQSLMKKLQNALDSPNSFTNIAFLIFSLSKPQILAFTLVLEYVEKQLERKDLDQKPYLRPLAKYKEEIKWLIFVLSFVKYFKSASKFRIFFESVRNLFGQNGPENRKKIIDKLKEFQQYLINTKIATAARSVSYRDIANIHQKLAPLATKYQKYASARYQETRSYIQNINIQGQVNYVTDGIEQIRQLIKNRLYKDAQKKEQLIIQKINKKFLIDKIELKNQISFQNN